MGWHLRAPGTQAQWLGDQASHPQPWGTAASPASPLGRLPQLQELGSGGPVGEISALVSKQGCLSTLAQQAGSSENECGLKSHHISAASTPPGGGGALTEA